MTSNASPSQDLPGAVDDLFDFALEDIPVSAPMQPATVTGGNAGLDPNAPTGFADGGMVAPDGSKDIDTGIGSGGAGLQLPGEEQAAAAPAGGDLEAEAKKIIRQQPGMARQLIEGAMDAIEMGELTEEMIMQAGKMAIVVSRNPEMYPKFVQKMQAMGEDRVPPEYDPEFVMTAILLMLAFQQKDQITQGGTGDMGGRGDDGVPDFADGGYVTHGDDGSKGGPVKGAGGPRDDKVRIDVSSGEYVIPSHIVKEKGREFFDKMLNNYRRAK